MVRARNTSLPAIVEAFDEAFGKALKRIVEWTVTEAATAQAETVGIRRQVILLRHALVSAGDQRVEYVKHTRHALNSAGDQREPSISARALCVQVDPKGLG